MNDGKANAFGFDMMAALNTCLDEAEAKADVIVLTAEGRAMSAGFDLKVMQNEPDRAGEMVLQGGQLLSRRLLAQAGDYRLTGAWHCRRWAADAECRLSYRCRGGLALRPE